jgi:hypothetical protein
MVRDWHAALQLWLHVRCLAVVVRNGFFALPRAETRQRRTQSKAILGVLGLREIERAGMS